MLQKGLMVFEVMMNLVYNLRLFFEWPKLTQATSNDDARGVVNSIRLIYSYYRYFVQLFLQQSIMKSVFQNTNKIKRNKINILTYPK